MTNRLRIFISSPGDVVAERRRAALVIEKLAKDYARFFEIKPYLWETEPMLASGHFQDAIVPPGDTDILILILWARLGTPLPKEKYRGTDGRAPVTGTEWEYEAALAAHRSRGAPDLLAYRKKSAPSAEYTSDADLENLRKQLKLLEAFWSRNFVENGEFRAAFGEFDHLDGFEVKLESDLRRLIERRIAGLSDGAGKTETSTWFTGSPFRGLESYGFEHAPIFFGRTEAIKIAVEHLEENAQAGRPFLLVLGASGTGKSSLVQAGIVLALGVRGVVPGVGEWRRAVTRPGGHPNGPFMALASALADPAALPELGEAQNVAALARHLQSAASDPGYPIVSALVTRELAARSNGVLLSFEQVRLILVIDQLEELFTLSDVTPDERKAFILCLKGLVDTGRIFVIATMRSDYWHRAAETPVLVTLAEGHGRLDLIPPTQAEIAEMIRRPAEVAGLTFETDPRTEIRLDAALAEEAAREPGALPLLSFLLDALYARDVLQNKSGTLSFASSSALGGLKGGIATRAEAAFEALGPEAQEAFPRVLRALVTVSRSGAEPTARATTMTRFAEGSPERRVVETFLDPQVRLLVADGDGSGARIRIAHEALITHWDRSRRQIVQDRDDLRIRATVEEAFREWQAAKVRDKRGHLLRDPYLANATDLARRWRDDFDSDTQAFIRASQHRARFLQYLTLATAAVFALMTVAASIFGVLAYQAKLTADRERIIAENARKQVDMKRRLAEMRLAAADELLDANSNEKMRQCVASTERFALQPPPLASKEFFVGRWHVEQEENSGTDFDWRADGTCETNAIFAETHKLDIKADICTWQFQRTSDKTFVIEYQSSKLGDSFPKKLSFTIVNPTRIHNTALNYDALRIICPEQELDGYQKLLIERQKLVDADGSNSGHQRNLSNILETIADVLSKQKKYSDALDSLTKSIATRKKLASSEPSNQEWQRELGVSYERIGQVHLDLGHTEPALDAYRASLDIRQKLRASNPAVFQFQHDLAENYHEIGMALIAARDKNQSREAFRLCIAVREGLAEADRGNAQLQRELVTSLYWLSAVSNAPDAKAALTKALMILEGLEPEQKLTSEMAFWLGFVRGELAKLP
jgi:tetratricopeptide (TPR) repeat protein